MCSSPARRTHSVPRRLVGATTRCDARAVSARCFACRLTYSRQELGGVALGTTEFRGNTGTHSACSRTSSKIPSRSGARHSVYRQHRSRLRCRCSISLKAALVLRHVICVESRVLSEDLLVLATHHAHDGEARQLTDQQTVRLRVGFWARRAMSSQEGRTCVHVTATRFFAPAIRWRACSIYRVVILRRGSWPWRFLDLARVDARAVVVGSPWLIRGRSSRIHPARNCRADIDAPCARPAARRIRSGPSP